MKRGKNNVLTCLKRKILSIKKARPTIKTLQTEELWTTAWGCRGSSRAATGGEFSLVILGLSSLSCSDSKELGNHFKRHAFGFRNLQKDENPRDDTDHAIDAEDASQPYWTKHDGQCVGDDDVTYPEKQWADGNAEATDPCGEDLRAKDVWDGSIRHDEAAEVDHDAHGWDHSMDYRPHAHNIPN